MKLATFDAGSGARLGRVDVAAQTVTDLSASGRADMASMLALIEGGAPALAAAREATGPVLALADVRLLAPIPVPPQIRDASTAPRHIMNAPVGMRRLAAALAGQPDPGHSEGTIPPIYRAQPIYYISNRFNVIGPEVDVPWPAYAEYMDYELEIAAVIGTGGRDIAPDRAMDHVFGYTIFNDVSARDAQIREMQGMLGPAKGKSFDGGNVMGPWIVTRDEIPDYRALRCIARINGRVVTDSLLGTMLHGFEGIIAHASASETLYPGEIIGSGTVDDGCGLERFEFLSDGDEMALSVDGIGTLRNRIVRARG